MAMRVEFRTGACFGHFLLQLINWLIALCAWQNNFSQGDSRSAIVMKKIVLLLLLPLLIGSVGLANAYQKATKASATTAKSQTSKEVAAADVPRISVDELILMMAKKKGTFVVIDVRVLDSYNEKIRGALQIPYDQVEAHLKDIPRNKEIITYCA
jgi:hypothetical protein